MKRALWVLAPAIAGVVIVVCIWPSADYALGFGNSHPDTLRLAVNSPLKPVVQRGHSSLLLYHSDTLLIGNQLRWSNGQQATAALRVSRTELVALARAVSNMQLPGESASTYSVAVLAERGPQPDGIPVQEYPVSRAGLSVRSHTRTDGWHRSHWIHVPWDKCSSEMFADIENRCSGGELKRLVGLLREHFESNRVQPAHGTDAAGTEPPRPGPLTAQERRTWNGTRR